MTKNIQKYWQLEDSYSILQIYQAFQWGVRTSIQYMIILSFPKNAGKQFFMNLWKLTKLAKLVNPWKAIGWIYNELETFLMTIQMHNFYFNRFLHHTKDTMSPTISRLMPIGCWNIGNDPASWNSRIPMFKHIISKSWLLISCHILFFLSPIKESFFWRCIRIHFQSKFRLLLM